MHTENTYQKNCFSDSWVQGGVYLLTHNILGEAKCSRWSMSCPCHFIWLAFQLPAFTVQELSWISVVPTHLEGRVLGNYYQPPHHKQPFTSDWYSQYINTPASSPSGDTNLRCLPEIPQQDWAPLARSSNLLQDVSCTDFLPFPVSLPTLVLLFSGMISLINHLYLNPHLKVCF